MRKDFKKNFKYTWEHKKAFLRLERELLGLNTLAGILHDTDKLFLYLFFSKEKTGKIHRLYSRHHQSSRYKRQLKYKIQTVIDYESSRYTKPDKAYGAREFVCVICPELKDTYLPIIEMLGL